LAAGIRVAGVDRDREPLEALTTSAREQGKVDAVLTIQTDLANDPAVNEIVEAARAGSAVSTSSPTTLASAREQSVQIVGNAPSSSGRSRPINGAAALLAGLRCCRKSHGSTVPRC
jgi:hypothetical protein